MKKKIILSLLDIVMLFGITGCGKKEEEVVVPQIVANQELGSIKFYVPTEYVYQPDLRGLAYTENDRKIYTNGDYKNRTDVIIIDVTKQVLDTTLEEYVDKINDTITNDNKYMVVKNIPTVYSREGYAGMADDVTVYNYTYLTIYNNYVYNVTVSGPFSRNDELLSLKNNILNTLAVGE